MAFTRMTVVNVIGLLVCGSMNTITMKISLSLPGRGLDGQEKLFAKPWFMTFVMFIAMSMALIVEWYNRRKQQGSKSAPLLADSSPGGSPATHPPQNGNKGLSYIRKVCLVSIPACFDILATGLCATGFLYISASVWQLLRGAEMVFAAMFAVMFLGAKMRAFNIIGICSCVVGISLVGMASLNGTQASSKSGADDSSLVLFGMFLCLAGQIVQAAQVTAEEWLMKDVDLPSNVVCGYEGIWGLVIMQFFFFPLAYYLPGNDDGHFENEIDTIAMLGSSMPLLTMFLVYTCSCSIYNMCGIAVTQDLTAVHRVMIEALRTLVVWAFDLYIHYYVNPNSSYGEVLTPWSLLEVAGFVFITVGTAIYGEMIRLPFLKYPAEVPSRIMSLNASPGSIRNLAAGLVISPGGSGMDMMVK